ncbi:cellulose biosynthesis protein BcsO [Pantoea sp. C2G6]|uniref:cellulose biosynthesis protein BcsO n=1 Tax=Pantoea sp. C2G6 TaxID=3243084 RepID=UPI003ED8898E
MKNYDDLQRFKEKTQTLDIAFKDMSGQTQEAAEQSKWALIRQLAKEENQTPFGSGQRIDLPQPQPLRGDEFSAPPPAPAARQATLSAHPAAAAKGSILDSLTGGTPIAEPVPESRATSSLFPPPPPASSVAQPAVTPPSAPVPPARAAEPLPVSAPPASAAEPGRFGALFRARDSETVSLPKETLLKPLLEKIALCH